MKKIFIFTLITCLLFSSFTFISSADNIAPDLIQSSDGFAYITKDDGTISIEGYFGESDDIIIPQTIDSKVVSNVSALIFHFSGVPIKIDGETKNPTRIIKAEIQAKITSVNIQFSYIEELILPSSINKINFFNCSNLKTLVVPEGVTELPSFCFQYSSSLTSVSLPSTLESIGYMAFTECNNLKEVLIPSKTKYIDPTAFVGMDGKDNNINFKGWFGSPAYYFAKKHNLVFKGFGDIVTDLKINAKDVLVLKKYIAKYEISAEKIELDINNDDKINTIDVLILRKYLANTL